MNWFKKLFGHAPTDGAAHPKASPSPSGIPQPDAPPPDMAMLAQWCDDAVHRQWPDAQTRTILDPTGPSSRVEWSLESGAQGALMLSKYWHRLHNGESASSVIASIEAGLARAEAREDQKGITALDAILPIFKPRNWQAALRQQLTATMDAAPATAQLPLARPTAIPDIVLAYAEDLPDAMGYISPAQCDSTGIDLATLHAHALDNLARMYLPQLVLDGGDGRYVARLDGNYDVSMMLLFDRWRDALELNGEPVIAIPARNEVLICGDQDSAGVEDMARMAQQTVQESAHALTPELLRWRPGLFDPLVEH